MENEVVAWAIVNEVQMCGKGLDLREGRSLYSIYPSKDLAENGLAAMRLPLTVLKYLHVEPIKIRLLPDEEIATIFAPSTKLRSNLRSPASSERNRQRLVRYEQNQSPRVKRAARTRMGLLTNLQTQSK